MKQLTIFHSLEPGIQIAKTLNMQIRKQRQKGHKMMEQFERLFKNELGFDQFLRKGDRLEEPTYARYKLPKQNLKPIKHPLPFQKHPTKLQWMLAPAHFRISDELGNKLPAQKSAKNKSYDFLKIHKSFRKYHRRHYRKPSKGAETARARSQSIQD